MIRWLLIGFTLVMYACSSPNKTNQKPNILFIYTDDHALQAIGAYGSVLNETPNIDQLAKDGMLFKHSMVTNSSCAPARAVVLTGKHSFINGVSNNAEVFECSQQTFPKILQKNGYQTAIIGKWHLKSQPTGFDHWDVLPGQGHYYNPDFLSKNGQETVHGYVTNIITEKAVEWLENGRDKSKPFLLMYQHKAPHREWAPDIKDLGKFENKRFPEPLTLYDDYSNRTAAASMQEMEIARHLFLDKDLKIIPDSTIDPKAWTRWQGKYDRLDENQRKQWDKHYAGRTRTFKNKKFTDRELISWKYQQYIKDYTACVSSLDENIGQLMAYLKEHGLDENTIIIYSSDNGFFLGEHGWFDKRWMYEESLHTPLIIKWPGVTKPGSVNNDLVLNLDIAETILDMAGIRAPGSMQGHSLVPLLESKQPEKWRNAIYYHYSDFPSIHMVNKHCGIRTDRYKLIYFYEMGNWELFDLEKDPHELHNVYADQDYESIRDDLYKQLIKLNKLYNDTTVVFE